MPPLVYKGRVGWGFAVRGWICRYVGRIRRSPSSPVSPLRIGFHIIRNWYRKSLPCPLNYGMIAPGNHWDSNSLRGAPPLQVREGMRSFGWYEFVGGNTAVEGFPHINDVYHHISLGVPERYRAQSGVTITPNASCGIIRRHCLQTTICWGTESNEPA